MRKRILSFRDCTGTFRGLLFSGGRAANRFTGHGGHIFFSGQRKIRAAKTGGGDDIWSRRRAEGKVIFTPPQFPAGGEKQFHSAGTGPFKQSSFITVRRGLADGLSGAVGGGKGLLGG